MNRYVLQLAAIGLMILPCGCWEIQYEIRMRPRGDLIQRELTIYMEAAETDETGARKTVYREISAKKLAALMESYPVHERGDHENIHVFRGEFKDRLPSDLEGAGEYVRYATSLGSAYFYVERLSGRDDQATLAEKAIRRADALADLLVGWSEHELAKQDGYEKLRTFLDEDVRRDLKNLAFYAYLNESLGTILKRGGPEDQTMLVRAGQYLVERGYLKLQEIPELVRLGYDAYGGKPEKLMRWVQRFVASRMGVPADKPVPASLSFLATPESAMQSLKAYVMTKWGLEEGDEADEMPSTRPAATRPAETQPSSGLPVTTRPAPYILDVVEMAVRLVGWEVDIFGASADLLTVELATAAEPGTTNGNWNAEKGIVTWHASLRYSDRELPRILYAVWAVPDVESQKKHFGRVILSEEELAQYCLWRLGLEDGEAEQWDSFLATLRPGPKGHQRLESFRFPSRPVKPMAEDAQQPADFTRHGPDLVLKALSGEPATQPASRPAARALPSD